MDESDLARFERLRERNRHDDRRRTTSLQSVAKSLRTRSRGLTQRATQGRTVDESADGDALRQIYGAVFRRRR
jgi:hypothetical protein